MTRKLKPPKKKPGFVRTRTQLFIEPELADLIGDAPILECVRRHSLGTSLEPMTISGFGRGFRTRCSHVGISYWVVTFPDVDLDGVLPTVVARPAHITDVFTRTRSKPPSSRPPPSSKPASSKPSSSQRRKMN